MPLSWTEGPSNGERWHHKTLPEVALLDQLRDLVAERDLALAQVPALRRTATAAQNRLNRHNDRIEELERQAAKTRRAFEVLGGLDSIEPASEAAV